VSGPERLGFWQVLPSTLDAEALRRELAAMTPEQRMAAAVRYWRARWEGRPRPSAKLRHWCASCEEVHGCHCTFRQCNGCRRFDCPAIHRERCPAGEQLWLW